jgi:hypothetical protein
MIGARAYFAACAALCGYALGYALPVYARWPRPVYDPLARRWSITADVGNVPMGYWGQVTWAIIGALVFGTIAALVVPRIKEPSARAYGLWAAWSLTALGVVMSYFAWNNWP